MPPSTLVCLLALFAFPGFVWADEKADAAAREAVTRALLAPEDEQAALVEGLDEYPAAVTRETLDAWQRGGIYIYKGNGEERVPFILDTAQSSQNAAATRIDTGELLKGTDGAALTFDEDKLEPLDTSAKLRKAIKGTTDLLALADPDPKARRSAILKLGMQQKPANLPLLENRLAKETNSSVRRSLEEAIALTNLISTDQQAKIASLQKLQSITSLPSKSLVSKIAADETAPADVRNAAQLTLATLNNHLFWVDFNGTIFRGISLGSVLLVVALGLAITFGLMGVINMAHGEIMVVGGYATYLVQSIFGYGTSLSPFGWDMTIPGIGFDAGSAAYQWYFIAALPVAFLSAALVGLVLERGIIQFLYRRPLESLLATWGVSLVLQQLFRFVFGPANVPVYSPNWLLGSFVVHDVTMNYNRVFVIGFAIFVVVGTALMLAKTPLGLLIRAVMQNRSMAACMGVRTERVNMLTFAFGSGLAGVAGAFLSQIGNIGPSTGQTYIVDSFMVVVVGGVGNIIGTVISALGIGAVDQILQTLLRNPVIGKVLVLGAIILFLQWRPQGLFATRSRGLES